MRAPSKRSSCNGLIRLTLAGALLASTLGAAHHIKARTLRAGAEIPFADAGRDGTPVAAAIRRVQIGYALSHAGKGAAKIVRKRPATVRDASAAYRVVNLDAILSGFSPTALNNDGRIVGTAPFDADAYPAYTAYFINYNGFTGPFPPQVECGSQSNNNDYCSSIPTAVTNKSGAAAGSFTDFVVYGENNDATYTGIIVWNLFAKSASIKYDNDGQNAQPEQGLILSMADQNIPVGGRFYYGFTPFPIDTCRISNFYATSINDTGTIVGSSNGRAAALVLGGCPAYVPNVGPGSWADMVANDGDMLLRVANTSAVWSKGRVIPIPLPSGYSAASYTVDALGINDNGIVVGVLDSKSGSHLPAVAFEYAKGRSVDLTSLFPAGSGWNALSAVAINDRDEIIGQGMYRGAVRGFALRY